MAKKQDNEVVTETVDVVAMKKQLDDVCGKVRRISDNWKVFAKKFIGKTDDGKMSGNVRVALALFTLAVIATTTYAASTIWQGYNGDAVKGTCKFVSDDAGATTLTVDKVVAASGVTAPITGNVTGDWTGDDLTANGSKTATLDVNLPTANQTNTITTKMGIMADTSVNYLDYLTTGTNDSNETINYFKERLLIVDITTNTEDSTMTYTLPIAGTDTDVLVLGGTANVTASKLTVSGALGASSFTGTIADGTLTNTTLSQASSISIKSGGSLIVGGTSAGLSTNAITIVSTNGTSFIFTFVNGVLTTFTTSP